MANHTTPAPVPILTQRAADRALSRWDSARGTGQQIRWAREATAITRAELAEYAGMSESTLARVENGERRLTGRERAAITRGLGVSLAFLTAVAQPRGLATDPAGTTTVHTNGNGEVAA